MTIANNYEIIKRLGQGGMGVVYLARDLALDKLVAVKMLSPQLAQDEKFLARFRLEARAQAKFDHPNVVRIHNFVEYEGNFFLVMEYVEGMTLDALIQESPNGMPFEKAWPLFDEILAAFEYAHNLGIIHRDIKPKNILIEQHSNRAKVADFGLARIEGQSGLTVTSDSGGTLAYMSPEQIENLAKVDYRTDIYSLGMTMYEALTGHTPFVNRESDLNMRLAIVKGKILHVRKANSDISRELDSVVMTALAPDPDDRWRSVGEMRRALRGIALAARAAANGKVQPTSSPGPPKRYGLKILTALFMMVLSYLVIQIITQNDDPKPIEKTPPPRQPQKFVVDLRTSPDGVTADIDGRTWGQTPLRDSLTPGEHRLLLTKLGYYPLDTTLTVETDLTLQLLLRAKTASKLPPLTIPKPKLTLMVATNPTGATARLNDGQTIITRNFFKNLERKPYRLGVYKDGYQPVEKWVNPADYENDALVINLVPVTKPRPGPPAPVSFTIDVRPFGTILLDGKILVSDHSGVYRTEAAAGTHQITVRHSKGRWMKSVELTPGGQNNFAIDFRQNVVATVTVFDDGGKPVPGCSVIIDGAVQDRTTPTSFELAVGLHEITVTKAGYRLVKSPPMPILLEAGNPQTLNFILQR